MQNSSLGRSKGNRLYFPRKGRDGGLRLHWRVDGQYVPIFPHVFRAEGLDYSPSNFDVFHTHFIEARYGPKPLMRLEHKACYELLFYQAEHGEKFYTVEMAKRLAISRHTLTGYLDALENLNLIRRVRNGRSFSRLINVVMGAPPRPAELDGAHNKLGYKLYQRVHRGHVQAQRTKAGPARWPLIEWDFATVVKMLKGEETARDLAQVNKAIGYATRIMTDPGGRYADWAEADWWKHFQELVQGECRRERYPYTDRLYSTALAIQRLNGKADDE